MSFINLKYMILHSSLFTLPLNSVPYFLFSVYF